MGTNDNATPRPWRVDAKNPVVFRAGSENAGIPSVGVIGECYSAQPWRAVNDRHDEATANAALIVRAVNQADAVAALVRVVEEVADFVQGGQALETAQPWVKDVVVPLRAALAAMKD